MMVHEDDPEQDLGFGEASPYAAHLDRGWSLLDQGDATGAQRSGLQAREILPEDPDACVLLAAAAQHDARFDAAVEWYEQAIEADPDYPEPYLAAAQILVFELEQYTQAEALLEQAQALDELLPIEQAEIAILLAECAQMQDDLERSSHLLDASPVISHLQGLFPKAGALNEDNVMDLVEDLCRYCGLDPAEGEDLDEDDLEQLVRRVALQCFRTARLYGEFEQEDVAAELLTRTLEHAPGEVELWHLLGDIEYRRGNIRAALQSSLKVHTLDAEQPDLDCGWTDETMLARVQGLFQELVGMGELGDVQALLTLDVTLLDRPSIELLYEGLDPRALFLVLRPHLEDLEPPYPATLVVYRQNLARIIQEDPDALDSDEVALQLCDALLGQLEQSAPGRARTKGATLVPEPDPRKGSGKSGQPSASRGSGATMVPDSGGPARITPPKARERGGKS